MLTVQQRRDYKDRRDVFRPQAGSSSAVLDSEGDPVSVASAYVVVTAEQNKPCQLVTKAEFVEHVGVAGVASVASRRFSKSLREEFGRDTQPLDVVKVTTRAGQVSWFVVKGQAEKHPNDGSRRLNWQGYDLAPTVPIVVSSGGGYLPGQYKGAYQGTY